MNQFEWARTSRDGLHLHTQSWEPAGLPQAAITLIHGYGEHCGRYRHVAAALTAAGYAIVTGDQRGHGRSGGPRGHTPSYDHLMDDVESLVAEMRRRFPDQPQFLYGHSMGGNLTLNYVLRRRPQLAGVVVTSPWLRLAFAPPAWRVLLGRAVDRFFPAFAQDTGQNFESLSRDPAVGAAWQADPLTHNLMSARLFTSTYAAGQWALAHAGEWTLPLLLMHGDADSLTSAAATREFAAQVPGCTLKLWPGLRHEMHNEPEQQQIFQAIDSWLQARLAVAATVGM